jgi:hypothetical protein
LSISGKGHFYGELVRIDLNQVWMQQGRENLPRVAHVQLDRRRVAFSFNAELNQPPGYYSGMELDSNAIFVLGPGSSGHARTSKPHSWAAMSLSIEDLSSASRVLFSCEPTNRPAVRLVHPNPSHIVRLVRLHAAVRGLAEASPETLAHTEVVAALEHEPVHALLTCLADDVPMKVGSGWRYHTAIIDRFEEVLAANCDRQLIGASA